MSAPCLGSTPHLQTALRACCSKPDKFDVVVTGIDAKLSKAAMGKQAMLDLHAGTHDKWLFKVSACASPRV